MSFASPANRILRHSVVGMEGMWAKMFDPPKESPPTPDEIAPTNPVPEVMAAAGMKTVSIPHTEMRDLLHGLALPTWDGVKDIHFMLIRDGDNPAAVGTFPGPTLRLPRGVIFHGKTQGHGPPPHTIHWHGIEPTPINDGVGHCSMEIGDYTYQWQPNFIGSYFYHCHRNTVQHFEFGLYGFIVVEPPDTYFATLADSTIPIGACRDRKFRTAANTAAFPEFPGFNPNPITAPDPLGQYPVDPHAMTIPYDVEALWVVDDRDSVWSDLAPDARATYPRYGDIPGVNDNFFGNAGGGINADDFFAFNDFNPDYFYVTGVPVPAPKFGRAAIPPNIAIPPELMSGKAGVQVSINAEVNQTILVRALDAAYANVNWTFPVDVVVIAWDGRALGVPPYGAYNHAYKVPAGTPIKASVARRFDALIRSAVPVNGVATVEFINTRGMAIPGFEEVLCTAEIPIVIGPVGSVPDSISGTIVDDLGAPMAGVRVDLVPVSLGGSQRQATVTNPAGNYTFNNVSAGTYSITPTEDFTAFTPPSRMVTVNNASITGMNFTGVVTIITSAISGKVTSPGGAPVAGVTMTLQGTATTAVTDAAGNYTMAGLADGTYVIVPTKAGLSFTPPVLIAVVAGADVTAQNFTAQTAVAGVLAIAGKVSTTAGAPLAGVTMTLSGAANATTATDAGGNYILTGLANGSYVVTPSLAGSSFTPPSIGVTLAGANATAKNFTAQTVGVLGISGTVKDQAGVPLAGVTIALTGVENATVVTNAAGAYSLAGLPAGNYTATPSLDGFTFAPAGRNITLGGANITGQNFIAIAAIANTVTVRRASVNARGRKVVSGVWGPKWTISGKASPNTTVLLFLGPDLGGEFIGTALVKRSGKWSFSQRVFVTLPITATSISVSSSADGVALNVPLKVTQ